MKPTVQKTIWTPCSVSWTKPELKELRAYAKIKKISLSAYIRSLAQRDRPRRNKQIAKIKGKTQSLAAAA